MWTLYPGDDMICCIWPEVVNHFEGLTTFQLPADGVLGYSTFKGILAYWNPLTFTENFHISRTFVSGRLYIGLDATCSKNQNVSITCDSTL